MAELSEESLEISPDGGPPPKRRLIRVKEDCIGRVCRAILSASAARQVAAMYLNYFVRDLPAVPPN